MVRVYTETRNGKPRWQAGRPRNVGWTNFKIPLECVQCKNRFLVWLSVWFKLLKQFSQNLIPLSFIKLLNKFIKA